MENLLVQEENSCTTAEKYKNLEGMLSSVEQETELLPSACKPFTSQCSPPADDNFKTTLYATESSSIREKNWAAYIAGCKIFLRVVHTEAYYNKILRERDWISTPIQETEACY